MKYGKRLRDEEEKTFREWKGQFICYKRLKKQLKLIYHRSNGKYMSTRSRRWPRFATRRFVEANNRGLRIGFTRLLDSELKKVNSFYFGKEEDYIIRLKELQLRAESLQSDEEKLEVQKDILKFHGEMVLLLNYSLLNFTGLRKIVKKHNKKTGTSFEFFALPRVMQQSFFSTDLLYNLMQETKTMLARLFLTDAP
ncbi:SPX domain-containing protein 2 isoform X1 [Mercurialis annua]|uniref:SPX domain-containing protein 2 isoform X1 n=1 Tax=Mercurialis annua TaxID=3986 RepID=UPI00215E08F7|nr:SPX domain-containing protein 2 isoform X1 [Mercurialis annua]XP_050231617.1 SPX domain-containing protein 2 isoform X1 [Mercurialis annua]XP_055962012.1 SPX domain-containing protein 2 isoform X1 [Mercurialis annua]